MIKRKKKPSQIFKAIEFAAKAHTGQFRKSTNLPYILHPLGVGRILIEYDFSEEVVIAGILHDTIEDTSVTLKDILNVFGRNVKRIVEGASEPNRSDSWVNRKQHTIDYLKTAPGDVLLVACADKLDNIRAIKKDINKIGDVLWDRFNAKKDKQEWYYKSLTKAFLGRSKEMVGAALFKEFSSEVNLVFEGAK